MAARERIAFLGAGGTMGRAMAANLLRAGFDVRAWNRTAERAAPLAEQGARVAASPAEAVEGASIIVTMLSDADAVLAVVEGAEAVLPAGALWIQASTIGEAGTARCAGLAHHRGLHFLDAPVLGTRKPAEEGKLVVLAAGEPDEQVRARARKVFDAIGQRTIWLGASGEATRLKLVANAWVLTVVEGCAEIVALAQGLGLDPSLLLDAVEGGTLDLPYLRMKTRAILDGDFAPSFKLRLAAKDAGLVEDAARERELDLPLLSTIRRRLQEGAVGHGEQDMIATYLTLAPDGAGGVRAAR
jgi:3-hydroxyisobutyrate dehydrogenase